jgi:hypothetical protein
MSNVIEFLERVGQDSRLRYASDGVLERALQKSKISPQLQAAVMSGDGAEIEAVLGGHRNVCCMINVPAEEDEEASSQVQVSRAD